MGVGMIIFGLTLCAGVLVGGGPMYLVGVLPLYFGYRQCAKVLAQKPDFIYAKSPRSHMWITFIGGWVLGGIFQMQLENIPSELTQPLAILALVVLSIAYVVVGMRRLNDLGMSRLRILLLFIPLVNIWFVFLLLSRPSPAPEPQT